MQTDSQKPEVAVPCTGVVGDERKRRTKSGVGGGAELTRAMQDALADIKKHGDAEFKNYRWNRGVMARAEWRNAAVTAEAPRVLTLEALGRRGLVEEYNEMKYCGHGEYDDWQCWRLVAAGERTPARTKEVRIPIELSDRIRRNKTMDTNETKTADSVRCSEWVDALGECVESADRLFKDLRSQERYLTAVGAQSLRDKLDKLRRQIESASTAGDELRAGGNLNQHE